MEVLICRVSLTETGLDGVTVRYANKTLLKSNPHSQQCHLPSPQVKVKPLPASPSASLRLASESSPFGKVTGHGKCGINITGSPMPLQVLFRQRCLILILMHYPDLELGSLASSPPAKIDEPRRLDPPFIASAHQPSVLMSWSFEGATSHGSQHSESIESISPFDLPESASGPTALTETKVSSSRPKNSHCAASGGSVQVGAPSKSISSRPSKESYDLPQPVRLVPIDRISCSWTYSPRTVKHCPE